MTQNTDGLSKTSLLSNAEVKKITKLSQCRITGEAQSIYIQNIRSKGRGLTIGEQAFRG